jgi:hypothetical protein
MTYVTTVAADSPDHWWRMADPGGAILHDIGSNAHTIPLFTNEPNGIPYSGMTSDGLCGVRLSNGGVIKGSILNAIGTTWSVECWAWLFTTNTDGQILELGAAGGNPRIGLRHILASGKILAYQTQLPLTITSVATPTDQAWHHFVLTYDHANLRLYIDGVLDTTVAGVAATNNTYNTFLLTDVNSTTAALGFIEDVATYTTLLSGPNVAAHFAAADQVAQTPVWAGPASGLSGSTGSATPIGPNIDSILSSVRKTY